MPNPTRQQVHADRPLTNLSVAFTQDASDFVADQMFPTVPVTKQGDQYYVYDIGDYFRTEAKHRAPGTESAGTGHRISTATYFCDIFAVHEDVPDPIRANADAGINVDRDAMEQVAHDMLLQREVKFAADFFTTSVWTGSTTGTDVTPGDLWDTVAGTPIDDVLEQASSIKKKTGQRPNTLLVGEEVHKELREHPDVIDRVKYTQMANITNEQLAALLGVDRYLVGSATRNTAGEEVTDSFSFVNGKNALLAYVNPRPGLKKPSAGYTFRWTGLQGGNAGQAVSKFRMEHLKSDRVEMEAAYDQKVVAADCGMFFSAVVS